MIVKCILRVFLSAVCLGIFAAPAFAHGVYIFAWSDGDEICTESYFSKKSKVRGGTVNMLGADGAVLASEASSQDGVACFTKPDKVQDLTFEVLAGEGHRGSFELPASEWGDGVPVQVQEPEDKFLEDAPMPAGTSELDEAQLRRIVREELEKQLAPLRQAQAMQGRDESPGVREIVGGLGWILALAACGVLFYRRDKNK